MEDSPSNAVLLTRLESMNDVILANQTVNHEAHVALLEQAMRTNGRVTKLESSKNVAIGFIMFANILVVPVAVALILKFIQSK